MKKIIIASGIAITIAASFSGCACKTDCGMNRCGDKSYHRNNPCYPKNVKFSKDRSKNFITPIPKQAADCPCAQAAPKCPTQAVAPQCNSVVKPNLPKNTPVLKYDKPLKITVTGQGVAPCNGTCSPAQAYAMAKRAAIADAYRLIAEKVKGVYVEGDDYIKNMMVKRSTVKTYVQATVRNANIVETTFKEGLCEVEMEITLRRSQLL
jgi:hypothetical protein